MRVFLNFSLVIIAIATSQSIAAVYQCEKDGVAIFSQFPCGDDAKEITIKSPNIAQSQSDDAKPNNIDSVNSYIGIQKIDREIATHQQAIKQLQNEFAQAKKQINYITQDSANRMGAASIADAINIGTNQLASHIDPQIANHQQQITKLQALKANLRQQSGL